MVHRPFQNADLLGRRIQQGAGKGGLGSAAAYGQTKVDQFGAVAGAYDVAGLDVPVHQALLVNGRQRAGQAQPDLLDPGVAERGVAQFFSQGGPFQELGQDVGLRFQHAHFEDLSQPQMRNAGQQAAFPAEVHHLGGVGQQRHFHGHFSAPGRSTVNHAPGPLADFRDDFYARNLQHGRVADSVPSGATLRILTFRQLVRRFRLC